MNKKTDEAKLQKKDSIIFSAKELIIKNGYQKTNVEDITKNIHIAKGSFYTYFKSKDEMILGIIDETYQFIKKRNEEILNSDMVGRELIETNIRCRFEMTEESIFNFLFFYHLTMNLESINGDVKKSLLRIRECNGSLWREIISRYRPELSEGKRERYSDYIDELMTYSIKSTLFYNNDAEKLFTSDYKEVMERAKSDTTKAEVEILCETILKILN